MISRFKDQNFKRHDKTDLYRDVPKYCDWVKRLRLNKVRISRYVGEEYKGNMCER